MDGADVLRGDVVLVPFPYVTDLIAARKLLPVELVETLIRRVELYDIQTRAFITRTFDLARQKAGRPRPRSPRAIRVAYMGIMRVQPCDAGISWI